ncbi:glycerol-3-phosphate dehydrogenase/oxidase [candidate division KSB1 bacterium]|nr:glycerol-3-phosphate dehydrogenase/oxidase [candidate division KSB1 bacterium]
MKRDLNQLSNTEFDILIIGAGIYGATAAWEAASRGFSVALIDKNDFGSGTSANSLKTVHGGLRYLQTLDLKRYFESVRERKILLRIAPHLVHPLPVVMPTYGHAMKGKEILWAGLLLNDIMSCTRNSGMDRSRHIPNGRVYRKSSCMRLLAGIMENGVTGCASWTDAQMYSSERMILSFIHSASKQGAVAANYVTCTGFRKNPDRILAVQAKDTLAGTTFEIKAKCVINMTGGWVDHVLGMNGFTTKKPLVQLSTAMNLVVNRELLPQVSAGLRSHFENPLQDGSVYRGSRILFVAPWRKYTMIGTFHRPYAGHPDEMHVSADEIQSAIHEFNSAYPGSLIRREDVSFVHKGFLPMNGIYSKTGEVNLTSNYVLRDHLKEGGPANLISVSGVKYTTARDVSQKAVNLAIRKLDKKGQSSKTADTPIYGGEIYDFNEYMSDVLQILPKSMDESVLRRLVRCYGSEHKTILSLTDTQLDWREKISGSNEVIKAEIVHAVRNEMAMTLSDVIQRRTDIGSGEKPAKSALKACAEVMGSELGWDSQRINEEIQAVEEIYKPFHS